jgi:hypothetical protein
VTGIEVALAEFERSLGRSAVAAADFDADTVAGLELQRTLLLDSKCE